MNLWSVLACPSTADILVEALSRKCKESTPKMVLAVEGMVVRHSESSTLHVMAAGEETLYVLPDTYIVPWRS